jgi:hypothetical protein
MSEDRCVCCGEIIPEGVQVCPICCVNYPHAIYTVKVIKDGSVIDSITGSMNEVTNFADFAIRKNAGCEISIVRKKKRRR